MRDLRKEAQARPSLVENIMNGLAVPIISDEAILDLALPDHQPLAQAYAEYSRYTLPDTDNLPRIAKYWKLSRQAEALQRGSDFTYNDLRADFCDCVKNFVYAQAEGQGVDAEVLTEAEAQFPTTSVTGFAGLLGCPRFDRGPEEPLLVLGFSLNSWAFRALYAGLIWSDGARRGEGSTLRSGRETASRFADSGYGSLEIRCKDQALDLERACHASRLHS